jgi:Holliday junction resolvase RusA-like endonuclease
VKPLTRIVVHALPGAQGSKRAIHHSKTGRIVMMEGSHNKVQAWRDAVRAAAFGQIACCIDPECDKLADGYPLDEPLIARMVFTFARPRSHYRTGAKTSHFLTSNAPTRPAGKPDLSKLLRSTEDALTDVGVWRDDARVVTYTRVAKVWAREDAEALDGPGVVIEVYPLGATLVSARTVGQARLL